MLYQILKSINDIKHTGDCIGSMQILCLYIMDVNTRGLVSFRELRIKHPPQGYLEPDELPGLEMSNLPTKDSKLLCSLLV